MVPAVDEEVEPPWDPPLAVPFGSPLPELSDFGVAWAAEELVTAAGVGAGAGEADCVEATVMRGGFYKD
jgi:hypothetical protein